MIDTATATRNELIAEVYRLASELAGSQRDADTYRTRYFARIYRDACREFEAAISPPPKTGAPHA